MKTRRQSLVEETVEEELIVPSSNSISTKAIKSITQAEEQVTNTDLTDSPLLLSEQQQTASSNDLAQAGGGEGNQVEKEKISNLKAQVASNENLLLSDLVEENGMDVVEEEIAVGVGVRERERDGNNEMEIDVEISSAVEPLAAQEGLETDVAVVEATQVEIVDKGKGKESNVEVVSTSNVGENFDSDSTKTSSNEQQPIPLAADSTTNLSVPAQLKGKGKAVLFPSSSPGPYDREAFLEHLELEATIEMASQLPADLEAEVESRAAVEAEVDEENRLAKEADEEIRAAVPVVEQKEAQEEEEKERESSTNSEAGPSNSNRDSDALHKLIVENLAKAMVYTPNPSSTPTPLNANANAVIPLAVAAPAGPAQVDPAAPNGYDKRGKRIPVPRIMKPKAPGAPGRKGGVQGRLSWLSDKLPIELMTEILSHLSPDMLLRLTRTAKLFRNLLLSKGFRGLWADALLRCDGLVFKAKDWNEVQYTSLMWDKECALCGRAGVHKSDYSFRMRMCDKCAKTMTASSEKILVDHPSIHADTWNLCLSSERRIANRTHGQTYYHTPTVVATNAYLLTLIVQDTDEPHLVPNNPDVEGEILSRVQLFQKEREQILPSIKMDMEAIHKWQDQLERDRAEGRNQLCQTRKLAILEKCEDAGYDRSLVISVIQSGSPAVKKYIDQAYALTDRVWAKIQNHVFTEIARYETVQKANREEQARRAAEQAARISDQDYQMRLRLQNLYRGATGMMVGNINNNGGGVDTWMSRHGYDSDDGY